MWRPAKVMRQIYCTIVDVRVIEGDSYHAKASRRPRRPEEAMTSWLIPVGPASNPVLYTFAVLTL